MLQDEGTERVRVLGELGVKVQPEHPCARESIPQCGRSHAKRVGCAELHMWRS